MAHTPPILAGAARRDVTPEEPHLLTPSGMTRTEPTRGSLDPLTVGALALDVGGEAAFILTSDVRRVWYAWMDEARTRIATEVGCDKRRVITSAVHNHSSSPMAADDSPEAKAALDAAERRIVDGFVEAALEAWRSRRPAELGATHARLREPVGLNRRIRISNGTCINNWHAGAVCPPGHRFVGPGGPHSTLVTMLAAREPGAKRPFALVTTYASHPHLAALPYFSGEVPGGIRRAIESEWPETTVLHANFTGGDIDMHDAHPEPASGRMDDLVRWFRSSADKYGRRVADVVLPAVEGITRWQSRTTLAHRYWSENEGAGMSAPVTIINLLALGDVAVLSIPAEMFNCYGERIFAASPFAETVMTAYNGSNNAYLVPPLAFEQGSYEVMRGYVAPGEVVLMPCNRRLMPTRDGGDQVAERAVAMLVDLHAATSNAS